MAKAKEQEEKKPDISPYAGLHEIVIKGINQGIIDGVRSQLSNYHNTPVSDLISRAIKSDESGISKLVADAFKNCLADGKTQAILETEIRSMLGKKLIQAFGGEIEKQVNRLKSDPTMKAKVTLILDSMIAEQAKNKASAE